MCYDSLQLFHSSIKYTSETAVQNLNSFYEPAFGIFSAFDLVPTGDIELHTGLLLSDFSSILSVLVCTCGWVHIWKDKYEYIRVNTLVSVITDDVLAFVFVFYC